MTPSMTHFWVDHTDKTLADLVKAGEPFGVRLRQSERQLSAWLDDEQRVWVNIGYVYRRNDGLTYAYWFTGAAAELQRVVLLTAFRAASESGFLRGSWETVRRSKNRIGGKRAFLTANISVAESEAAAALSRALFFASSSPHDSGGGVRG